MVSSEVYEYIKEFAAAKDSSISAVIDSILSDWYKSRRSISAVDKVAHDVAAKSISSRVARDPDIEAAEAEVARRRKVKG